jgi:heavy metal translocating P-type ATPase
MKNADIEKLNKELEALKNNPVKSNSNKEECPHCSSQKKKMDNSCCTGAKEESQDGQEIHSCCSESNIRETIEKDGECPSCSSESRKKETIKKDGESPSCCSESRKNETIEGEVEGHSCCSESRKKETIKREGECPSCYSEKGFKEGDGGDQELASCCSGGSSKTETCCGTVDLGKKNKTRQMVLLIVSLLSVIASYLFSEFHVYHLLGSQYWGILDPAWIAIVLSGYTLYVNAFKKLKKKKITSSLLVSMAMTASIIIGFLVIFGVGGSGHDHGGTYFFVAGEVAFIMAIGAYLEDLTIGKSKSAIEKLISMKPSIALIKQGDGTYKEVNVAEVVPGNIVLVRPNESISVDGVVIQGNSAVDYSSINGESIPVECTVGSVVFAGTRNMSGALEIETTKRTEETTLSKIIAYIKEAEKKKAPVVRIADKWASYLVVVSLIISIAVLFIGIFGFKLSPMEGVSRAATVLVVFCPCALALATPIAVAAGIGSASKKGILIKSGSALESLAKIDTVAFDKTGTLTEGKLRVEEIYPYEIEKEELMMYAASAEAKSEHPLAKAIIQAYGKSLEDSDNTVSLVGNGVESVVKGKKVGVYKLDYIKDIIPKEEYNNIPLGGRTVVGVLIEEKYAGAIAISDTLRKDIADVISELRLMNMKTVMLTGDSTGAANKVGEEIGIDTIKSQLMPEDKVNAISELKNEGAKVLMIGDGVNDAAALASSDCSLAIGAMGSSVAMETAESSLLSDDMKKIPVLLRLAKRTLLTIRINITLSLAISFVAIVLSMLGYIDAVIGALIHNGSSTLVCIHSALLLLYKAEKRKTEKNKNI